MQLLEASSPDPGGLLSRALLIHWRLKAKLVERLIVRTHVKLSHIIMGIATWLESAPIKLFLEANIGGYNACAARRSRRVLGILHGAEYGRRQGMRAFERISSTWHLDALSILTL